MRLYLKDYAQEMFEEASQLFTSIKGVCGIAIVTVGDDPASLVYVKNKLKKLDKIPNVVARWTKLSESISQDTLNGVLEDLSLNQNMHGILLQQPLPKHLDAKKALRYLDPAKDVDGLTAMNKRFLLSGLFKHCVVPCTALGIMKFLEHQKCDVKGKTVLLIGRSDLVVRPLATLLEKANATLIWANSHTAPKDLLNLSQQADVIISAAGVPHLVTDAHINTLKHPLVIDVGMNKDSNDKLIGDCDIQNEAICDITAVPGGVGQLTTSALLLNLYQCYTNQN